MMKIIFAILSVATLFISPDCGGNHDIKITDAWATMVSTVADPNNPDAPAVPTANVYLTIANNGKEADTLAGVATTAADSAQIMQTMVVDGMSLPQALPTIVIKTDHEAALRPGKTFIQLVNVKQPLVEGASFQLTFTFEKAGEIKQSILVQAPGSKRYKD